MDITQAELNREIRIAENRLGVLRREWFVRSGGVWPPVGWIGGDNTGSEECKEVNVNATTRMKEFGL